MSKDLNIKYFCTATIVFVDKNRKIQSVLDIIEGDSLPDSIESHLLQLDIDEMFPVIIIKGNMNRGIYDKFYWNALSKEQQHLLRKYCNE